MAPPKPLILVLTGFLLAFTLLAGQPAVARAEQPTRLPGYVTDTAQVLSDAQEAEVAAAVEELYGAERERLWVVYVRDFAGMDPREWGERTAAASNFGDRDVLLSVAVDDRAYAFTGSLPQDVGESDLDRMLTDDVEPRLRAGDWAGAAVATAHGLSAAMNPPGTNPLPLLIVAAVVVLLVAGLWWWSRSRRAEREWRELERVREIDPTDTAALTALPLPILDTRSRELLVDIDNAIRTSTEELRLATDEFGNTTTAPFAAALEAAKHALATAFSIRQQLDDAIPESPDQRRGMLVDLIATCGRADRELDAKVDEFDAMRNLLINAGDRLDALTRSLVELTARMPGAETTLDTLVREHPASVIAPIRDNVRMAHERIAFAEHNIEQGRAAAARPVGEQGAAVGAIRAAESAVDAARTLLDAVDTAATDIAAARSGLAAMVAELRRDLATAETLGAHGGTELPAAIGAARDALEDATANGDANPLGVFQRAVAADTALDKAIAAATDRKLAADDLARRLDQAMTAARGRINAAADFISTRRGGVDAEPRTRLAEAQRHLDRAQELATTNPGEALQSAQRAVELGASALHTAEANVRSWQASHTPTGGSQTGAVLGGILIDGMLRGMGTGYRRGGGFGGGFSRGGGRGMGPGSFGGSQGSRRISRGGRF
ncbi:MULTISPECIES: TPM domain-containing protein [unclassified Nocardia]|uniref:TPM domain-containing protein n=2 Tax=Nocardia TaxID=1817 RepID=UPI00278BED4F|nr:MULTISPECIES: TPM domain-containing protein [unclassified Nocardia]